MSISLRSMACCGIREMHHLARTTPINAVKDVYRTRILSGSRFVYVMYTATTRGKYGGKLHDYINNNDIGTSTHVMGPHRNPNSNNKINVWIWRINKAGLTRWGTGKNIRPVTRNYWM